MNTTKPKSFWSSIPGFFTGVAGVLTGVVGLITVLIQLDVIGGDSDTSPTTTTETGATTETTRRAGTRSGAGAAGQSGQAAQFSVTPTAVRLDTVLNKQANVLVRNTGAAPLTVDDVTVSGQGASEFAVSEQDCTAEDLAVNNTCSIEVRYEPSARGEHTATLTIEVAGAASPQQVSLSGSRPL
ncbi:MAG TPA: choice-of-anchor D domain-containing protein [Acidimicrobiales bacterium]|jgi:cytoskeletal protein RodZ|nr:choice-of-anchor D domain-containing protein [Acidimicrobiales bacterium]